MSSSSPPRMPKSPTPPKASDLDITTDMEAERLRKRRAAGRSGTILTGDLGAVPVVKKTLLGE